MKLVSRAQWGARAYRLPSGATLYAGPRRGVKLHYLGSAYTDRTHDRCDDYVRQIQAQHMDGNGWSDIGYSFVVCTHGYVYEGRGLRRRNSANGNTTLNEQDYAICLLVGSSGLTKPTDAQLNGARDAIDYCRKEGPAGTWLGGHRDGYATACPGDVVYAWAKAGAPRPTVPTPVPPPEADVPLTAAEKTELVTRTADQVAKILLRTDGQYVAPTSAGDYSPDPADSRHWWSGQTLYNDLANGVRTVAAEVAAISEKVDSIEANALTEAQIAQIAAAVAANPALADAIADNLAARLAS